MGCCLSRKSSSACKIIRLVNLNGSIEDFDYPVTVGEVTGKSPNHFVCTHDQLLSACSTSLTPDARLQRGEIYFLLPFSVFQSAASTQDFATIAKRLSDSAKSRRSKSESGQTNSSISMVGKSPSFRSPASRPNQLLEKNSKENGVAAPDVRKSTKLRRSWKPILATIREKSFNRRSESDLSFSVS